MLPTIERPFFSSDRLLIEPVIRKHAHAMVELLSDPSIFRFLEGGPPTLAHLERQYSLLETGLSADGTQRWITWICSLKAEARPIGFVQATVRADEFSSGMS
jgi:hypothetical protein